MTLKAISATPHYEEDEKKLIYVVVMVELVGEVAVLLLSIVVVLVATWTTLAALLTVVAMWTTLAVVAAWATWTLLVAFWLLEQHAMRELVFAGLRINLKQLDLDVVTLLDSSLLYGLQALPENLGDVEQAFLARKDLDEATVRHDALYHAIVNLANLRQGHDALDFCHCRVDALLVRSRNLHVTDTVGLVDGDSGTCVLLHLLDNLAAGANDGSDELLRNVECLNAWHLRLELLAWLRDGLHHLAHDVLAAGLSLHESLLDDVE